MTSGIRTHGMSTTPTYQTWRNMQDRVDKADPKARHQAYANLTIYPPWRIFENFFADMGERPDGMTLDRIKNSKGYEPGNCRWASHREQGANRDCVQQITFQGRTQNPEDWARELGLHPQTIRSRLTRGWPAERALTVATRARRKK